MCFDAIKITFKVAKRNRTYYKVLQIKEDGKLYPPYRDDYPVFLDQINYPLFDTPDISVDDKSFPFFTVEIRGGFLHLCRRWTRAIALRSSLQGQDKENKYIVVKAIIPRGALYAKNSIDVITNKVIYKRM